MQYDHIFKNNVIDWKLYSVFFNLFSNVNFKRERNYEFYDKNGQYKLLKTQI